VSRAVSARLFYGLSFRFQLLSTSRRRDAVTFNSWREAPPRRDFHPPMHAPSQAHERDRPGRFQSASRRLCRTQKLSPSGEPSLGSDNRSKRSKRRKNREQENALFKMHFEARRTSSLARLWRDKRGMTQRCQPRLRGIEPAPLRPSARPPRPSVLRDSEHPH